IFVPLTTVAVSKVPDTDTGIASALLNVGQQVGGSIGLSVLATVAATSGRNAGATKARELADQPQVLQHLGQLNVEGAGGAKAPAAAWNDSTAVQALHAIQAHSSAMGFLPAAIFGLVAVLAAALLINIRKSDLPADPMAAAVAA